MRRGTWMRAAVALTLVHVGMASGQTRLVQVGDLLEPLPRADDSERPEAPRPGIGGITIVFVAAHQERSARALTDLAGILVPPTSASAVPTAESSAESSAAPAVDPGAHELVVIVSDPAQLDFFRRMLETLQLAAPILLDTGDVLRNRLGVRVTPTTVTAAADGRIIWVRAGHSFDYHLEAAAAIRAGSSDVSVPGDLDVPAVNDAATDAPVRADRLLRVARALAWRGNLGAAVAELRRAAELDPGAPALELELAELLCRNGDSEEALRVVARVEAGETEHAARALMIEGWAHRQLGALDRARARLTAALALDTTSARAHFEFGKVLEAEGDDPAAMAAYRRALELRFGERADASRSRVPRARP